MKYHQPAWRCSIVALSMSFALTACGGGRVNSTPTPTPSATPTPAPTPTPSTINFDTAEYRRTSGAVYHGAITAWQDGATGAGVTVGVIDTGIDISNPEFSGRISSASAAFGGNSSYQDEDGHGTAVTGILAAARNNNEIMGIAFNATILALRADQAGTCADEDGCEFYDSDIAAALDRATQNGARVVNISLGGPDGLTFTLRQAVDRATKAGVIIVASAGNERDSDEPAYDPNNPSPFALGLLANGNGLVIIANSVDQNGQISEFSDLAGTARDSVLGALGDRVRSVDLAKNPDFYFLYSGTSFAAPQIAGAAALLAQAFPNLSSAQIVELLLDTATDAGTPGTDSTYGRGILNIAAAFAPQGTTSLAGSSTPVSLSDNGALSAPMGDAAGNASVSTVVLDSYSRAYALNLGSTLRTDSPSLTLAPLLQAAQQNLAATERRVGFALSIAPGRNGGASVTPLMLSSTEAEQARIKAGYIAMEIDPRTQLAIGFSYSAGSLAAMIRGKSEPAFLIASSPARSDGFRREARNSFALRWRLGGLGLTIGGESGDALIRREWTDPVRANDRHHPYSAISIGIDHKIGPAALSLSARHLHEQGTVLGARFSPQFGAGSARTLFLDADMRLTPGNGWGLGAEWRQGRTWAAAGGALTDGAIFRSDSFALDIWKDRVVDRHDRLALRVSQPLRISAGGLNLMLPDSYDYATGETGYSVQRYNLAPAGRQIDVEAAYGRALSFGDITANLYYRKDNGNITAYPDDIGAAIRFTSEF